MGCQRAAVYGDEPVGAQAGAEDSAAACPSLAPADPHQSETPCRRGIVLVVRQTALPLPPCRNEVDPPQPTQIDRLVHPLEEQVGSRPQAILRAGRNRAGEAQVRKKLVLHCVVIENRYIAPAAQRSSILPDFA